MKSVGTVQFRLSGLSVEKLLNEARRQGVSLQSIRRGKDRALTLRSSPAAYAALCALAREKGFQVSDARPVGMLKWTYALRRRWGLIFGALLGAGILAFSLGFVWQVQVENAGAYAGEIRSYLKETGIVPGIRRSQVDLSALREQLEWRLPSVKWVRTEFSGVTLRVRLEAGVPPPTPEDQGHACDVVAAEDGILSRLTVFSGTPCAQAGDLVRSGQVLIKGEERGADGEILPVKARGEAIARVWISTRVRLPAVQTLSSPTGRTYERRVLAVPYCQWCGQDLPDYLTWDEEITEIPLGGAWVPIWLKRERYAEAALENVPRSMEEIKAEGKKAALFALNRALIDQEVVDKWINFSMIEGDTIVVTATAEISRDIGRQKN